MSTLEWDKFPRDACLSPHIKGTSLNSSAVPGLSYAPDVCKQWDESFFSNPHDTETDIILTLVSLKFYFPETLPCSFATSLLCFIYTPWVLTPWHYFLQDTQLLCHQSRGNYNPYAETFAVFSSLWRLKVNSVETSPQRCSPMKEAVTCANVFLWNILSMVRLLTAQASLGIVCKP